jgi:hypothetical protein
MQARSRTHKAVRRVVVAVSRTIQTEMKGTSARRRTASGKAARPSHPTPAAKPSQQTPRVRQTQPQAVHDLARIRTQLEAACADALPALNSLQFTVIDSNVQYPSSWGSVHSFRAILCNTLLQRFRAECDRFAALSRPAAITLLYHGTSASAVKSIEQHGLLPYDSVIPGTSQRVAHAHGQSYGVGCYVATDFATAANYGECVLVCLVLLGRQQTVANVGDTQANWARFDSRFVLNFYVVATGAQILPIAVIRRY